MSRNMYEVPRCRHNSTSWLLCGGLWNWCWKCGAIQKMEVSGPNHCWAVTRWTKPTGANGKNPWPMKPTINRSKK